MRVVGINPMVVGIDFRSASLDLVTIDIEANDPRWHHATLPGSYAGARDMRAYLPHDSWWDTVVCAAVEKPMSPQRNSISALMRLQGAILATIPERVTVLELPVAEWKIEVGLPGNADKPAIARWALDNGADVNWSQDAMDALGIAVAMLRINTRAAAA